MVFVYMGVRGGASVDLFFECVPLFYILFSGLGVFKSEGVRLC